MKYSLTTISCFPETKLRGCETVYIYGVKDIQKIDSKAVEEGFTMFSLMENAGRELFYHVKSFLSKSDRIIILAGKGNNGGDGVVLARYLKNNGYNTTLTFPLGEPTSRTTKEHLFYYKRQGFSVNQWDDTITYNVIIDSLLGIGTKLPLREDVSKIISWCNRQSALKIAIDLPTGVQADHGEANEAFRAHYTFCLHGVKPSAFLLPSSNFYGKFFAVNIGLAHTSNMRVPRIKSIKETLPEREMAGHKGTFGTSLLIAGCDEMPGSALLGAIGAMRSGVGKLTIATTRFAASIIAQAVPEATYLLDGLEKIAKGIFPEKISAAAIGPGIADEETVKIALHKLMQSDLPLVVDAGALHKQISWKRHHTDSPTILTPHPGEFSRLTGYSIKQIQSNRISLAKSFAKGNGVTVVLKGKQTVIAFPDGKVFVNPTGNNALAKGGSGDILTGMLVSMLATHKNWRNAVVNAVYIHGLCADKWAEKRSKTSMTASDFNSLLPIVIQQIEKD